jgi:proteasome lid subunit RPN8/RPN11
MAYQVSRVVERSGGRLSLVLDALPKDGQQLGMDISIITVDTLPVVHGAVERLPSNLGELADQMASKGIDVLLPLRQSLLENITANGLASKGLTLRVILLLRTPIVRAAGNLQERIEHKAFFFHADRREIGRAIGAYLFSENKFYADVFGHVDEGQNAEWRAKVVSAIEVLSFNSKSRLRIQSGVSSEGPKGVLVGVGSLGSAMLNIWTRCGWGEWSVIDNDHIKPHNLVRHTAFGAQVGELKVKVVSQLCEATTHGAAVVTPINADATSLTQEVVAALQKAQLVVDASASLDFPRAISKVDQVGRHISVFITPDGNAAVMLAEDSERLIRLLSLEAQYYRAVINSGWGMNHLNGHLGTYWSGASCRDISMALPYSRVLVHAACFAEQVQQVSELEGSFIRIWQRNPQTGAVELHSVETQANRYIEHGEFRVFIDEGLEQKLWQMRSEKLPSETGGVLLGYHDLTEKVIVIVDACVAPEDSISTEASFQRGVVGVPERLMEVAQLTAGVVGYIGEWHSHPPGCPARLSNDDLAQLTELAMGMREDGLPAFSLIVSESEVCVYQGVVL